MPEPWVDPNAPSEEEVALGKALDAIRPRPDEVHGLTVRFGEDWWGQPAMRIEVVTDDDLNPSRAKVAAFEEYAERLSDEAWRAGTGRWPFIRIVTE